MAEFIDIAVIGGGPAGLTAAATLARQLHTAVVFDSHSYRNTKASQIHMVPGWENKSPHDFRLKAREDILANYRTIRFEDVAVEKIEKKNGAHFLIGDVNGKEWNFRKVILAVGSADVYPPIPGYGDLWATRIFHCLFCKGYEDRGASSVGVLAVSPVTAAPLVMHMAENAAQLSDTVTLYTNGDEELTAQLEPIGNDRFNIESRQIRSLAGSDVAEFVTVEFTDGSKNQERFLVHNPTTTVQGPFVEQLGIKLTPIGDVEAEAPAHQTSVRGVFAAGDCITPYKVIPGAISSGCNAAVAACTQLQAEKPVSYDVA
ncbi:FAD/NAD(P)-binding domain-containing protein [Poronia punctata]|nr:FAD/NAD(P)-binding domain-containing protein [Poronia punctata]